MSTPWIVIAATIAAIASIVNIVITFRISRERERREALSALAAQRLDWLKSLQQNIANLQTLVSRNWRHRASKAPVDPSKFDDAQYEINFAALLLDPNQQDEQKLYDAVVDLGEKYNTGKNDPQNAGAQIQEASNRVTKLCAELLSKERQECRSMIAGDYS
ncbi:MAG: hypothetical protein Hens3KO_11250 [Henriciella sp.]